MSSSTQQLSDGDDNYYSYLAWERSRDTPAFARTALHNTKRIRVLDCGHRIDVGEPYRYQVWKYPDDITITQRTDCDHCKREDDKY